MRVSTRADDCDKHTLDVNQILFHKGKVYSAGDDGKIKVWQSDLTKLGEVQAHSSSVFAIAAADNKLYSCSNDGTVKSWEINTLKQISTVFNDKSSEIYKIWYSDGHLFAGDNDGNVFVFNKEEKSIGQLSIAEPVKDMIIQKNFMFTVNQLDLVITELKMGGEHLQFCNLKDIMGKAPVTLIDDKLIIFASRTGKDILVHENSHDNHYRQIAEVKNAHPMIINSMLGVNWDQFLLFSGGWDKNVKRWKIVGDKVIQEASVDCEFVINTIASGEKGFIYCGGSDGHMVRVDI